MPELTLESLAARVAELERKLALQEGVVPASRDWREVIGRGEESDFGRRMQAEIDAAREASRKVVELTSFPELADNPWWGQFQAAMRENRERMAQDDAERLAAEDAATRHAG